MLAHLAKWTAWEILEVLQFISPQYNICYITGSLTRNALEMSELDLTIDLIFWKSSSPTSVICDQTHNMFEKYSNWDIFWAVNHLSVMVLFKITGFILKATRGGEITEMVLVVRRILPIIYTLASAAVELQLRLTNNTNLK